MKLSLIVAMDERRLIGSMSGGLPWQGIERDREHFRSYVKGKALLLGRKTYEEMEANIPIKKTRGRQIKRP